MCVIEARPTVLLIFLLRFVTAAALGAHVTGDGHLVRACLIAVVWELAVFSVYLFNGVMDVAEDRLNGSDRPIASGSLPVSAAARVVAGSASLALAGGFVIGLDVFLLVVVLLAFGFCYSGPPAYLKRRTGTSAITGMSLGFLTYLAGYSGYTVGNWAQVGTVAPVFAIAMILWMGLVGSLAKDLSDIDGDVAAGRRPIPAVLGETVTLWVVPVVALVLAAAFCVIGITTKTLLVWPGLAMLAGAVAMAVVCLGGFARGNRLHRRRPYRVFMTTQYLSHLAVLTPLTEQFLLSG